MMGQPRLLQSLEADYNIVQSDIAIPAQTPKD